MTSYTSKDIDVIDVRRRHRRQNTSEMTKAVIAIKRRHRPHRSQNTSETTKDVIVVKKRPTTS